ncbi:MAG: class I tRNA ligase family protein, partial [Gemmatimonadaceae bacterium]
DGNFSWERFEERYNSDLANAFGNLASRVISMIERYREGVVPSGIDEAIEAADASDLAVYHSSMNGSVGYLHHEALKALWRTIARANEFVDRQAPWKLAKDPASAVELDRTLASLARQLMRHAVYAAPFMPERADDLWRQLGAPGRVHQQTFSRIADLQPAGWQVVKGAPLFPKEQTSRSV